MTALHPKDAGDKAGYLFTSESVSEGHPDKVCDQISDAILDAYIAADPMAKVACETLCTKNRVILSGEISSKQTLDVEDAVRKVIREIGYIHPDQGFDDSATIQNYLHAQTQELQQNEGAGDQGLMFGYACRQSEALMPLPIEMAHLILQKLAQVRKNGEIPALLPDSKSQVSFRYEGRRPVGLETVVLSTHHQELSASGFEQLKEQVQERVILPAILQMQDSCNFDTRKLKIMINPLGLWHNGGPASDTGLTGRKIIVDTYGGWANHGGGAFSGKDASKVDRSAAYMARHIAKSVVASGWAEECLIQFSFVIGDKEPVSLMVDSFGSARGMTDSEIEKRIRKEFDLTVSGIIKYLDLRRAIYLPTAKYGHFGTNTLAQSWEQIKILD